MMKKLLKNSFSLILSFIILCALCAPAFASDTPDLDRKGSITVTLKENGKPVPYGSLVFYKVADITVSDGDYGFVWSESFINCELHLDNLQSDKLANDLYVYASKNNIKGIKAEIDKDGTAVLPNTSTGLYLVTQYGTAKGYSKVNPFLITVPLNEDGKWVYNVDASPKVETEKTTLPSETTTAPAEEPELPFTGQLTWPIPVLAVSGVVLFVMGFMLYSSRRKKNEK